MADTTICRPLGPARVLSFEDFLRRREPPGGGDPQVVSEVESPFTRGPLFRSLTPKEIVHRETMLGHLRRADHD